MTDSFTIAYALSIYLMLTIDNFTLPHWSNAYGTPPGKGKIRTIPADFIVKETLAFEPSGSGEHIFLHIQKTGENTEYVARQLARFAHVRQRDVGYAGMKDRHAITMQWFSIWLPKGDEPNWSDFCVEGVTILSVTRHARKLKRGALACNHFELTLREWQGDIDHTLAQLTTIKRHGIPNYYGSQRFGHRGQNIVKALAMFNGEKVPREQRSIYLSAVRSFLFNTLLAQRIHANNWATGLSGDVFMLDGSRSGFVCDDIDETIRSRLANNELHPTGALYGKGDLRTTGLAHSEEQSLCNTYTTLIQGLIAFGLESDRRALRVNVHDLTWHFDENNTTLLLAFSLPAGSYATAVLREIIELD